MNRRVVVLSATCAIVLAATGIAIAATRGPGERQLQVVDKRVRANPTDETTTTLSTTTIDLPSTTAVPVTVPETVATATAPPAPLGLEGTLTMSSTTVVAGQPVAFTLTLHNPTAEDLQLAPFSPMPLGVWIDTPSLLAMAAPIVAEPGDVLAPGEVRTRTLMITPPPQTVGQASVRLAYIINGGKEFSCRCSVYAYLDSVPPAPISIVAPGWVEGQPLEPSQGDWSVTMSASSTEVRAGDVVTLNATVRNVGSQLQKTAGYGSLAISCGPVDDSIAYWWPSQLIGENTLRPGDARTFSFEFSFPEAHLTGVLCDVGVWFGNIVYERHYGLESDAVTITVLPAPEPTTTARATTTTAS